MTDLALIVFLLSVLFGSYFQAITGFAMGMIILAVMGATQSNDVPMVTAVVSLLSLVNVLLALRGRVRHLHKPMFFSLAVGQVSAIWLGVWIVLYLDQHALTVLQLVLGAFITAGALSMLLQPHAKPELSSNGTSIATGFLGGLVGGMFSASGPVLGWYGYRQPLSVDVIRATLLACFAVTTSTRTVVVGVQGGLTSEVWLYAATGLPVVVLGTWLGRKWPPAISEDGLKRFAFAFLLVAGLWIIGTAFL